MENTQKMRIFCLHIGILGTIMCLFLLSSGNARAATRDVCSSGCDYATIQDAVNASSGDSDVINVGEGIYDESVMVPGTGTASFLTLHGAGADSTTIRTNDVGVVAVIPVEIKGFKIEADNIGIILNPVLHSFNGRLILVESNTISTTGEEDDLSGGVIVIGDQDDPVKNRVRIKNNTFNTGENGYINFGIGCAGYFENSVRIEGNIIVGNYTRENGMVSFGTGIFMQTIMSDNPVLITHNNIDISDGGLGLTGIIISSAESDDLRIANNDINVYNSDFSFGIMFTSEYDSEDIHPIIYGNMVTGANTAGIAGFGMPGLSQSIGADIYNNVVYNGRDVSGEEDGNPDAAGIYMGDIDLNGESSIATYSADVYNNTIFNNVSYNTSVESGGIVAGARASIYAYNNIVAKNSGGLNAINDGSIISSHNAMYENTRYGASNYMNTVTGDGDISADPDFIDSDNANFDLAMTSSVIDRAMENGAPDTDILNRTRPSRDGYDMGAYEYQNQAPVINGIEDMTYGVGMRVNLNGSETTDPENDDMTYLWTQTSGEDVELENENTKEAYFYPKVAGIYTFTLLVTDQYGAVSEKNVSITVADAILPMTGASLERGILKFILDFFQGLF